MAAVYPVINNNNNVNNNVQQNGQNNKNNDGALLNINNNDPLGFAVIPSVMNVGVPELGPYTYRACLCCSLGGGISFISNWNIFIAVAGYILAIFCLFVSYYLFFAFLSLCVYSSLHLKAAIKGLKFLKLKNESEYYAQGEVLYTYYLILCTVNYAIASIGIGSMILMHYYGYHYWLRFYFAIMVLPWATQGSFCVYNIYILKQYFREKAFQKWQRESLNQNMYYNKNNVELAQI